MRVNARRNERILVRAPVRVMWQDPRGASQFGLAQSVDISENGIRIELRDAIEPRSWVGIQAERIQLTCSGTVRSCNRRGMKYQIGIEFNSKMKIAVVLSSVTEASQPLQNPDHSERQSP